MGSFALARARAGGDGVRRLAGGSCLVATATFLGCAHTYGLERQRDGGDAIPGDARVYVAMPEAGRYATHLYAESGKQTRDAIAQAIGAHVAQVDLGARPEDHEAALRSARDGCATYAIVPIIEHWEERATEWSGKPDRIIIDIRVFEVGTGEVVDAAEISGKSRWATFGGDHPQELLPRAVGDYVAALFP